MQLFIRLLAVLVVMIATFLFIYWVPFSLLAYYHGSWIPQVTSALCALVAGWQVWDMLGAPPSGPVSSALLGALILGSVGFCAGTLGPVIFAPGAGQGPLLGLVATGPAGLLLGGIGGWLYWRRHRLEPKQ